LYAGAYKVYVLRQIILGLERFSYGTVGAICRTNTWLDTAYKISVGRDL